MSESFVDTLSKLRTRQFFAVFGQTFLVHNYILTLPLEINHVWPGRWTAVKIIFLLNRYGNLIGQSVFTLEELGLLSHRSVEFCSRFPWFLSIFGLLSTESIHILVLLRAWAIWGCKYSTAVALISAYGVYSAVSLGLLVYTVAITVSKYKVLRPVYLDETGVCIMPSGAVTGLQFALPFLSLSLDAVVIIMVSISLAKVFKRTQGLHRSPVFRVLAIDTAIYFVTSVIVGIIAILCDSLYVDHPQSSLISACIPLINVTGQRVVLNLRRLVSLPQSEQTTNRYADGLVATRHHSVYDVAETWTSSRRREVGQDHQWSAVLDTTSEIELVVQAMPEP